MRNAAKSWPGVLARLRGRADSPPRQLPPPRFRRVSTGIRGAEGGCSDRGMFLADAGEGRF